LLFADDLKMVKGTPACASEFNNMVCPICKREAPANSDEKFRVNFCPECQEVSRTLFHTELLCDQLVPLIIFIMLYS